MRYYYALAGLIIAATLFYFNLLGFVYLMLPGFIFTWLYFKKDIFEYIALSLGFSMAFVILLISFVNIILRIPLTTLTIYASTTILIMAIVMPKLWKLYR